MKTLFAAVLLSLSTLAFAQTDSPVVSTRMTGNFADSTFSINGNVAHIAVSQDSSSGETLLIYNYLVSNPDGSHSFIFGGGDIPNDAAKLNNTSVASMNVDTSQVAGFRATTCTFFPGQPSTCTSGPFGVIQIDWKQNGVTSNETKTQNWQTFPGGRIHLHLDNQLSSADVSGTFLGGTFTSNVGDIGATTNSLFEIFQN